MTRLVRAHPGHIGRTTAGPAARGWLAILIAFLFCWQTAAIQGHVHLAPPPAPTATGLHAQSSVPQPDTPATCPLCRELLHAGQLLAGTPPALAAPLAVPPLAPRPAAALASAGPQWSHAWRGRAPPSAPLDQST
jgi:hypothetical protein